MFLVVTLGIIGTWQVFDQICVMSQGHPAKTTLTPAYLSYRTAFRDFDYGSGAAISFVLFLIIVPDVLVGGPADRPPGAHHPHHPVVPGARGTSSRTPCSRCRTRSTSPCRAGWRTWSAGRSGPASRYPLTLGAALLATIPVAIIFVIFQRYFVHDTNEGAEKG
jgi:hypothetical protein